MYTVSNSKIKQWNDCRYAWYLKYVEELERKAKHPAFERGGMVHSCLEAWRNGKAWKRVWKKLNEEYQANTFQEERDETGDMGQLARIMVEGYIEYHQNESYEYLASEQEFKLQLTPDIELEGYIDAIVKDPDGVYVFETKTYSRMPSYESLLFNNQSAIYQWALREMGHKRVKGTIWDILLAKEPSQPYFLKNGDVSKAALASTPGVVIKWCKENDIPESTRQDLLSRVSGESFYQRHTIRVHPTVEKQIMEDVKTAAIEMAMAQSEGVRRERNLGLQCGWCSYKPICQAEILGTDPDYIKEHDYKKRENTRKSALSELHKEKEKKNGNKKQKAVKSGK
jgi:RecB family exonuclease